MAPSSSEKKRRKDKDGTTTLAQLKALGQQLLSARAHINNLPRLLSFLSPTSAPQLALESLLTLQSFFVTLLPEIHSAPPRATVPELPSKGSDDAEEVYRAWLRSRFDEFANSLIQVVVCHQTEEAVRDICLDALMEFVKLGKGGKFQSAMYHKFIHSLVQATSSIQPVVDMLSTKFFKFLDVRCFTYTSLGKIMESFEATHENGGKASQSIHTSESRSETALHNVYNILSCVSALDGPNGDPGCEMWCAAGFVSKDVDAALPSGVSFESENSKKRKGSTNKIVSATHIMKKLKSKFTKAWISFLKIPFPVDLYKQVLVNLPQLVIPYIANPVILCDFLTRSYDIGGVISIMALSSLFILITQHGVEYPHYYDKLYALLTPSIFMAKHRARFLQLLDTSLKSSHIPAYVAAAFTKKLSRLALSAPPSGSLVIIAIIHNLLRRHPSINFLVHKASGDEASETSPNGDEETIQDNLKSDSRVKVGDSECGMDPFDLEECDLVKSNAMRSSLWEVDTMRHHYCPAVSRFVASLENDLTVRSKTSEVSVTDFCSGSYTTIFRDEVKRRIKQVPLAFYKATPTSLFSESEFPGWSFGDQLSDQDDAGKGNAAEHDCDGDMGHLTKRQKVPCS